jgi:spore coat protein A
MGAAGPLVALLNYVYYEEAENDPAPRVRPALNSVEQWDIVNLTGDTHPTHLHLVQLQIVNRQKVNVTQYLKAYIATGPRKTGYRVRNVVKNYEANHYSPRRQGP